MNIMKKGREGQKNYRTTEREDKRKDKEKNGKKEDNEQMKEKGYDDHTK